MSTICSRRRSASARIPQTCQNKTSRGGGGGELTPLPPVTLWLLSEASFVLEEEEGGSPNEQGESDIDPYERFLGDLMGPESPQKWPVAAEPLSPKRTRRCRSVHRSQLLDSEHPDENCL